MQPKDQATVAVLQDILLTGKHPDGRALGRALAHRLADLFGVPRPEGWGATT